MKIFLRSLLIRIIFLFFLSNCFLQVEAQNTLFGLQWTIVDPNQLGYSPKNSFKMAISKGSSFICSSVQGGSYFGNGTGNLELVSAGNYPSNMYGMPDMVNISTYDNTAKVLKLDFTESAAQSFMFGNMPDLVYLDYSSHSSAGVNLDNFPAIKTLKCQESPSYFLNATFDSLQYISCYNSGFKLSELYVFSQKISDPQNKLLGTQNFDYSYVETNNPIDFSKELVLGVDTTKFLVTKGNLNAISGVDYKLESGVLTFLKPGTYNLTMTNNAIVSHPSYPAKEVRKFQVKEILVKFKWDVEPNIYQSFKATANGGQFLVNYYGSGYTRGYTANGIETECSESSYKKGLYEVGVCRNDTALHFTGLNIANKKVRSLSIFSELDSLNCSGNYLSLLDLYNAAKKVKNYNNIIVGNQTYPTEVIKVNDTIDLSSQIEIEGVKSKYIIIKNNSDAIEGLDYILNGEKLILLKSGQYVITLSNPKLDSILNGTLTLRSSSLKSANVVLNYNISNTITDINSTESSIKFSPNCSDGIFYFYNLDNKVKSYQVYNNIGSEIISKQCVSSQNEATIDLSSYPKGVYIIIINFNDSTLVKKIIKR